MLFADHSKVRLLLLNLCQTNFQNPLIFENTPAYFELSANVPICSTVALFSAQNVCCPPFLRHQSPSLVCTLHQSFFKKWWFWVIIVVILAAIFGNTGTKDSVEDGAKDTISSAEQQTEEKQNESTAKDDISFVVTNVPNDVTGNWRIASIAENIEMQDYALDYYKEYFKSDDEIHAIVNFNYKTTTKISVMGNLLDVSVYEYVDKEEHDAKLLFSGMLLKEYHVNKDTGEIEEIQ